MPEVADPIESLFASAVALPPEEREVFLEREGCQTTSYRPSMRAGNLRRTYRSPSHPTFDKRLCRSNSPYL